MSSLPPIPPMGEIFQDLSEAEDERIGLEKLVSVLEDVASSAPEPVRTSAAKAITELRRIVGPGPTEQGAPTTDPAVESPVDQARLPAVSIGAGTDRVLRDAIQALTRGGPPPVWALALESLASSLARSECPAPPRNVGALANEYEDWGGDPDDLIQAIRELTSCASAE